MSVFPEKERPVPPKVVVCIDPLAFVESNVPVANETIVDDWKVVVAPCTMVAVHVPDDAKVMNPGFTKLMAPVEVLKEIGATPERERSVI